MNRLASSFFAMACACAGLGMLPFVARADELPQDTNHIESLTPEQAWKLAAEFPGVVIEIEIKGHGRQKLAGCLPLNRLESLDAESAKALAECKAQELSLNGLTALDAETATALAEFNRSYLRLNSLAMLSAETAKALAEFKGRGLVLDGLTTLDAETAKALAVFKAHGLYLNGLTTLDAETATALAECGPLHLNGLTTLCDDAAKALAEFKGQPLSLKGLTTLSTETARLVCASAKSGSEVSLPGLTALDTPDAVEIAKILATAKGRLSMPNLEKISPKTLTALIEKTDVMIPRIETLELIPEPDGSPTEDFVIP